MSVSVNVGLLAQLCEFDPESAEHLEAEIAILNELLAKNCLPRHDEPRQRVSTATSRGLCGFPYSYRVRDANPIFFPAGRFGMMGGYESTRRECR